MIPPLLIVHRAGAEVIRDISMLPPLVQTRIKERRRHGAIWWASNGCMVGVCLSYAATVTAQGGAMSEWTQPSSVMALVTLIFAGGQMWNARLEDRRRITKLEETSVTKEAHAQMAESIHSIEAKLDRLIERGLQ